MRVLLNLSQGMSGTEVLRGVQVTQNHHGCGVLKHNCSKSADSTNDGFMQLQGIPFTCTKEEIILFLSGFKIVPNVIY